MRTFKIITPLKVRSPSIKEGEAEYLKRLRGKAKFELIELEVKRKASESAQASIEREGDAILKATSKEGLIVVLDERGRKFTSTQFSDFILGASGRITFVIGGADGISQSVRNKADEVMSLSTLTFPFQLVRLILIEQIYRAFSINEGTPYHK